MKYDVIVVGGGHAGCEASLACARMGNHTLLITSNINNIGDMPCNPSVGGSAKGIVVREIDALGGEMGINTDKALLQIKMLNVKKGPGVRSLRAQADKTKYPYEMIKTLKAQKNLTILEDLAKNIIVQKNLIIGVETENSGKILSKKVILTTGTYLNSSILVAHSSKKEGPHGEKTSLHLSKSLEENGLKLIRLKTGTPPRIDKDSIDFSEISEEKGDNYYLSFSNFYKPTYDIDDQEPCYLTYTNKETHKIILDNLEKCALYSGMIKGIGPRYCPSIEDKIVKFKDKERHQIFIEPQRKGGNDYYVGGFSTTMPHEIQEQLLKTMNGLKNVKILKYGYAIEYDAVDPTELNFSLETKKINGLYLAGQINGTSGYEEAAAQGLIAGINASLSLKKQEPIILKRNEAYIGVLIDDLINKGITEPYRLLTSRAEFRLLLRHDNASIRLTELGHKIGLITEEKYKIYEEKITKINKLQNTLKTTYLTKDEINNFYNKKIVNTKTLSIDLLKRPEIEIKDVLNMLKLDVPEEISSYVEISIKYKGYIEKTEKEVEKLLKMENKKIPQNINYENVKNIATEARQKFMKVKPLTIGQASRISGVNPSDITMLLVYLKKEYPYE